ncbi:Fungal transcriptional regulatory protein [Akanthomyces lecanii RCEF 1005]|uniref:Fungal transcriptional regulatory protein n=1 Tax=Akanthomyces lecanii RCEF 1005 TaxID=1081108 RepID=A0A168JU32_CORDF|nr:Fungal transcriptional regulatory protein [Akanthomyces lecanii RCEF 1005]
MADFLASFNFGAAEEEPTREEACASLDEVQSRFRDVFEGKVTETRAEHMKISIDIGPSTQFTIFGGDGNNVDPSLSRITAREALVSQPQQNPITQRAVSQEILNALSNIDGSTWSGIDELRKAQGWVLAYVCNHSWQQWTRHGKAAQTHAILDYSQKELDFMSRARPAFDCRGTVTITFSKTNSAITVNYSHTPFHRTVGEVYDLFKPPPPPPRAVSKQKAPGSARKSDTPRRKRAATGADGEPVRKKPRPRPKKGAKNQLSQAELVPMTEGFASANGMTTAIDAADHVALAALSAATTGDLVPNSGAAPQPKNNTASLNVSPEEAARRRETATNKLIEAGIDPATLNADQFSIFSNQSPEVQTESLNMLAKYGAERLHIVHPAKKDSPRLLAGQPDAESIASGSCSKERPTCTVCQESGLTCEYPVAKPRNRRSAAFATEDEDTVMSENVDAEGEAEDARADAVHTQAEDQRQPSAYGQVPIADMMQITPDEEGNGSRPIGEASLQPTYEYRAPTSSLNWNSGGLALPQGRVYYPPAPSAATKEPLPNNARTVVETAAPKRSQRVSKPTAKAKSHIPTPVQALIASPPRERHESPLERHNPRRHEAQPRNPLAFDRSPPYPYGQPVPQPQYASDPYRQNPSYGQNQGAYPQLQETAPERIAYDPNAYRSNAPPKSFNQQKPPDPTHTNAATGSWPSRGQDVASADTLQRIHGYGGSSNTGNTMLSVHPPNQHRSKCGGSDRMQGVMGAAKHGSSGKSSSSQPVQQQVSAAPNQPQSSQQSWYGFNGLHGGSATNTQSNHSWGGSGGGGGWN